MGTLIYHRSWKPSDSNIIGSPAQVEKIKATSFAYELDHRVLVYNSSPNGVLGDPVAAIHLSEGEWVELVEDRAPREKKNSFWKALVTG